MEPDREQRGAEPKSSLYQKLRKGLSARIGTDNGTSLDQLLERLEFNGLCDDPSNRGVFPTTCVCGMTLTSKVLYFSDPLTRATFNIGFECVKGLEREALRLKVASSVASFFKRTNPSPDFSIPDHLSAQIDESNLIEAAVMEPFRPELRQLEKQLGEVVADKVSINHDDLDTALAEFEFALCEAICLAYGKFSNDRTPLFYAIT